MITGKSMRRSRSSGAIVEELEVRRLCTTSNFYFLETSPGVIGFWGNTTHQGTGTPTTTIAATSSYTLLTGVNPANVTVDESGGQAIPNGGLTVTGTSGVTNQLLLIGTSGNDTVNGSSSAISFGSTTASFSNVNYLYYSPNGGSDNMHVTSGELYITAGATGGGILERQFSSLSISSGATMYMDPPDAHADRTVLVIPNAGFIISGKLDMTSNDLIVTGGSWSGINGNVANGDNTTTSVTSYNSYGTLLGVVPNNGGSGTTALYSTFDGVSVTYSAILIKWTYQGDANDSGAVNSADGTLLSNGYTNHLTGWYNGDFNYDGVVDGSDYTLYDTADGSASGL
jgi:hypothetical protein